MNMWISDDKEYTCSAKNVMGLTIPGCGWKGKGKDLVENYRNTLNPMHPLSGSESIEFHCPKCGRTLDEVILKQS